MRHFVPVRAALAGTMIVVVAVSAWGTPGAPASEPLLKQGFDHLKADAYAAALKSFVAAENADPQDLRAVFAQGVALNRLGRYTKAKQVLDRAAEAGLGHPELNFERGWACVGSGHHAQGAALLEAYEQASPGRGITSELLGEAYLWLGQLDQAERNLHEAGRRDPALRPALRVHLAQLEIQRGRTLLAAAHIAVGADEAPNSPVGAYLRKRTEQSRTRRVSFRVAPRSTDGQPAAAPKRWRMTLTAGTGWNNNVLAVADNLPIPLDISNRGSAFGRFSFNFAYDLIRNEREVLEANWTFQSDLYEGGLDQANLIDNYWYHYCPVRSRIATIGYDRRYGVVSLAWSRGP